MRLIINENTSPYFNLALEEHFLAETDTEAVILWRNSASVIIGRNQNAFEEVNLEYVKENGIKVVRRLSGGGAVFHDLGNVNFTIIRAIRSGDFSDYGRFTGPVIEYLAALGVRAELQGRNDLTIDGAKFCGNAQARCGGRIMHHGCVLYDADFSMLAGALAPRGAKFESHGVKSVRKRVTNIAEHLSAPMTARDFFDGLCRHFAKRAWDMESCALPPEDAAAAEHLAAEKYSKWEWNFGASPAYNMKRSKRYAFGTVDVLLSAENGVIKDARIYGDFFGELEKEGLEELLSGARHDRESLTTLLSNVSVGEYINGMDRLEFIELVC